VLAGTWEALLTGQADLAIGVGLEASVPGGVQVKELGSVEFVYAVAPHHPLAGVITPITDAELIRHRAVAVADSAQRLTPLTVNLLPGQDVLTVASMQHKIEALLRCMGAGFVPEPMVREHIAAGRLVVKTMDRGPRPLPKIGYAWRTPDPAAPGAARKPQLGLALRWWLNQLESPATRTALLQRHGQVPLAGM
jgi:DNA-binding transcriptional LysR family regulator